MNDKTRSVSRIFIRGTIEDVWREVTKTGEAQKCMFNMVMHTTGLRPGAKVQMRTINNKFVGVVGEVLEIDPPFHFSMTFRFTQYDDPPCRVTYDLKQVDNGVEFTLTCDDLPAGTKTAKQMPAGGEMIVGVLKDTIENGRPSFKTRILHQIFKFSELFSPEKTKVEHWPLS